MAEHISTIREPMDKEAKAILIYKEIADVANIISNKAYEDAINTGATSAVAERTRLLIFSSTYRALLGERGLRC